MNTSQISATQKIFSFDFETVGLDGPAWAAAAVVYEGGKEVARFEGRTDYPTLSDQMNDWERENVLPVLGAMPKTHDTNRELLEAFAAVYFEHKDSALVVAEAGFTVEGGVFRHLRDWGIIGTWDGPYVELSKPDGSVVTLYDVQDVASYLLGRVGNPSVNAYITDNGIALSGAPGSTHHPTFDCIAAATAMAHAAKEAGLIS